MSVFKRDTSYAPNPDPAATLSPYDRARREWDNRIGSARVQAFHWRLVAVLSLITTIALSAGLVHLSSQKDVKAFIVEVDRLGQPGRVTLAEDDNKPSERAAGYFIGELVALVRARPLDPVVVRENWKKAYAYLAGDAVQTMNAYAVVDPPLHVIEGRPLARTVQISNVLQKSRRTYQVRWVETDFVGGVPQPPTQYTGLFQIDISAPLDEAEVFRNPLGIYVVSFNWSKEFTQPILNQTQTADEDPNQEGNDESQK